MIYLKRPEIHPKQEELRQLTLKIGNFAAREEDEDYLEFIPQLAAAVMDRGKRQLSNLIVYVYFFL